MKVERALQYLRISLAAGIVYDLVFAAFILIYPSLISFLFNIAEPRELIYLKLNAVFLVVLCLFYALAVYRPEQYQGNITVAVIARFTGAVYFAVWVGFFGAPAVFLILAAGDAAFGIVQLVFFMKSGLKYL